METFIPRASTNVAKVEYDRATQLLTVHFQSGGVYDHTGVPVDVFIGMQNAQSVGGYYHRQVKGQYDYTRRGD